jgi:hypothetical protein
MCKSLAEAIRLLNELRDTIEGDTEFGNYHFKYKVLPLIQEIDDFIWQTELRN